MGVSRVVLRFPAKTGLAKDDTEMGFVLSNSNNNGGTGDTEAAMVDFITGARVHAALGTYLSSSLAGTWDLLEYDITGHLGGGDVGSPIFTALGAALPAPSTLLNAPRGVCAVLAFNSGTGSPVSGPSASLPTTEAAQDQGAPATHTGVTRPRSRHEGRIYFGPLNLNTFQTSDPSGRTIIHPNLVADLADGAHALSGAGVGWAQWSRRDAAVHNVIGGWIDNSTHYQRRREEVPGVRTPWAA